VQKKPTAQEIKMATALVEGLHREFDPAEYEDAYREQVLDLIKRKAAGKNIEMPEPEEPEDQGDLLAALEASLSA
jgi:DNA end-binding protein Ku